MWLIGIEIVQRQYGGTCPAMKRKIYPCPQSCPSGSSRRAGRMLARNSECRQRTQHWRDQQAKEIRVASCPAIPSGCLGNLLKQRWLLMEQLEEHPKQACPHNQDDLIRVLVGAIEQYPVDHAGSLLLGSTGRAGVGGERSGGGCHSAQNECWRSSVGTSPSAWARTSRSTRLPAGTPASMNLRRMRET